MVRPDEEIVSFDVVSLFTLIPVDLALEFVQNKLDLNYGWKEQTNLTKVQIMDLLKFVLNNGFFFSLMGANNFIKFSAVPWDPCE